MSFKIERGLFKGEFIDYYAVLGVPIDANAESIRKRYKIVARQLHPDSCQAISSREKELATQLFSKLVSPAYTHLSKEQQRTEYQLVFKQIGRNIAQNSIKEPFIGELAKKLQEKTNVNEIDLCYQESLKQLVAQQYKKVSQSLDIIASLSELNLAYIVSKEQLLAPPPVKLPETKSQASTGGLVEQYIRRANEHIGNKNFAKAVLELRDAVNLEPNNSTCHSLLGKAYLFQNQPTMANMYVTKALNLNAKDPIALEVKKVLDRAKSPAKNEKKGFFKW